MPDHILVVSLAIAEGREDDYRTWHDRHIAQILEHLEGVTSARRYERGADNEGQPPGHRYMAIYELADEPAAVRAALRAGGEAGLIEPPPAGVVEGATSIMYEAAPSAHT
jgi:hypothetical protein